MHLRRAPRQAQVLLVGTLAPLLVRTDGKLIPQSSSPAALRRTATGWAKATTPFPGIVLKLAPRSGSTTVSITLR
jgi:hypothetical protein